MPAVPAASPCVLIVDDDPDMLELTQQLVHRADPAAQVVVAQGGLQAMAYLGEASRANPGAVPVPDLILRDINMPDTSGFEVLRWVRRQQALAEVKVVMLSTSDSRRDIERATELGAHGYLIKFPQRAVLACVLQEAGRGTSPVNRVVLRQQQNDSTAESIDAMHESLTGLGRTHAPA